MVRTECSASTIQPVVLTVAPVGTHIVPQQVPKRAVPLNRWLHDYNNGTRLHLLQLRRNLPGLTVLRGISGLNTTEVLEYFLRSGLPFRDLSRKGKRWGMLACMLSHFRALEYQVQHAIPWQLTLEDDVRLVEQHEPQTVWAQFLARACDIYTREQPDIMPLSFYNEAALTSLAGATRLTRLIRAVGIVKNPDQQLNDPNTMGRQHKVVKFLGHTRWKPRPWKLRRAPNSGVGVIYASSYLTWTELMLLRLLTHRNGTQHLPRFGNPPSANFLYRALRGVDHTAYHDLTPGARLRSVVGTRRRRGMAMGRDQLKQLEQPQLPPRQTKGALPSTVATNGALPSVEP